MEFPELAPEAVRDLRLRFADLDYTVDGVNELLGERAARALGRNETVPGRRATAEPGPLATLVRLWPLQTSVSEAAAAEALGDSLELLLRGGILATSGGEVRAVVDIRPYGDERHDWWVCADLTPGLDGRLAPVPADHVLGVNAASTTLAQLTVRPPVERALDLGTGCGVQALHLAEHAAEIVGTDLNERAIALARITAGLNGLSLDLRRGDLYEPVAGEGFDLVVSNPPFVVSPSGALVYRESGLPGDEVSRRVIVEGAQLLREGGWLVTLANWLHVAGEDWRDRVGGWVEGGGAVLRGGFGDELRGGRGDVPHGGHSDVFPDAVDGGIGCDAWVLQREVQDPAEYVELWLRDSGVVATPGYREAYDRWLGWLDEQSVEGIGFGWVVLRRRAAGAGIDGGATVVRIEHWPHPIEQPLGPAVEAYFGRVTAARALGEAISGEVASGEAALAADGALAGARLRCAPDVVQEQVSAPGAENPDHVVLRQRRGLLRAREVDAALAGLVGACDGRLPIGVLIDAVAEVLERDASRLRAELLPAVRELLLEGFLIFP